MYGTVAGKPPVLRDVAKIAGTSVATASRALSGGDKVAEDTAHRVRKAARQIGFVLNHRKSAAARSRSTPPGLRHGMVALGYHSSAADSGASFQRAAMLDGIAAAARDAGVTLTFCRVTQEDLTGGALPAGLSGGRVDGALVHPARGMGLAAFRNVGPVVLFGCRPRRVSAFPSVESDSAAGVDALLGHLCGLGHRRLAFLSRHLDPPSQHIPYVERRDAFLLSAAERGCRAEVEALPPEGEREFAARFRSRPLAERPTALVASCDGVASRLLAALQGQGVSVPAEVSVTGFDGHPVGEDVHPRLTTWHVLWHDVGRMAFELLLRRIRKESAPHRVLAGGELRVRASCGPPPG